MQDPKFDESRNPNIPAAGYRFTELKQMGIYLLISVVLVWLLAEALIRMMPALVSLERERQWFGFVGKQIADEHTRPDKGLQNLADDLAQRMQLPAGSVRVFRSDEDTVNAFATFGGHIVIYQGLLDKLPDEESVAAVLAHEIAHVKHRDALRGTSRSLLFALIVGAATGGGQDSAYLLTGLEGLRYSRSLEEAADAAAVQAVQSRYGNVGGAVRLFHVFEQVERQGGHADTPQWAQSHPDTAERIRHIRALAAQQQFPEAPSRRPNPWRSSPPPSP